MQGIELIGKTKPLLLPRYVINDSAQTVALKSILPTYCTWIDILRDYPPQYLKRFFNTEKRLEIFPHIYLKPGKVTLVPHWCWTVHTRDNSPAKISQVMGKAIEDAAKATFRAPESI